VETALAYLTSKDKILGEIIKNFGIPVMQKREEGFASMCHIILEQQVSIASAKACYDKLLELLGEITPNLVANSSEIDLKNCGISRQKTAYIKQLAEKVITKQIDFDNLKSKSESQVRAELIQLKGVGNWSIDVYLMFCMQAEDVIPLGDIAIKKTLEELYNCQSIEEMVAVSDAWKPYRTLASFIVWHHYLKVRNKI
jgi:DNA-3-methyladenine glycosylase II